MFKKLAAEINFRKGRRQGHIPTLKRAAMQDLHNSRAAIELARLGVPENICASLFISLNGLRVFAIKNRFRPEAKELLHLAVSQLEDSRGQFFQDVAALYFSGQKRNGFFVEVGTGDGETHSNTFMLEKQFDWRGILFEPDRRFHAGIRQLRNAVLETRPVYSSDDRTLQFLEVSRAGELSTLADFKREDGRYRTGTAHAVETVTLTTALRLHNAPTDIDYVSIDTEGSELEVLKGFDLDAYNVKFLTIEHNFAPDKKKALADYLRPYGYREVFSEFSYLDIWLLKD